jgi:hypothetical protein
MNNKEYNNINIVPLIRYINANFYYSIIYEENKGKSGIYRWINNINGKSHIGSSISLSYKLNIYYSLYYLRKEVKGSIIIYRALKYVYSNFSLDILEYCELDVLIEKKRRILC